MEKKFYYCRHCGNVVVKEVDSGVDMVCCGEKMQELVPNTTDGTVEKHLPVVDSLTDGTLRVKVGSQPHPMTPEHRILFIYLQTKNGGKVKYLDNAKDAVAFFCKCDDKPVAVYEYCNLHGLWKTNL
ncbi:MAG: desulfoferrodoxin [Paludibacteraceae bacterium]|nr:desulfoferrodoxin [Paludibacteraceae bacterium]